MDQAGLRDEDRKLIDHGEALGNYFNGVLPPHRFFDEVNRIWSWSTTGGFWSIRHLNERSAHHPRPKWSLVTTGPDVNLTVPDDESGIGITMALLRCLGAIARDAGDQVSVADLVDPIVERCRAAHWTTDGMTDAEFVAGVLAVLEMDGRLVTTAEPEPVDVSRVKP